MAKKLPGLSRVLGPRPLASVAYGEIASSLYFALGVVAYYALGFTPWVLLAAGIVFMLVALSYAEGTAAIPETGGAATLVRRAFNDPLGFMTGWALFLDYLIVIALAALFVPHYFGDAVGWDAVKHEPWDVVVGACVIAAVAAVRLVRRTSLYRLAIALAGIALVAQLLLIVLGFVYLVSSERVRERRRSWDGADLELHRIRDPGGDARVHRPRDRRQPRRRGPRAGEEPPPQPLRRDRRRCGRVRRHRDRGDLARSRRAEASWARRGCTPRWSGSPRRSRAGLPGRSRTAEDLRRPTGVLILLAV